MRDLISAQIKMWLRVLSTTNFKHYISKFEENFDMMGMKSRISVEFRWMMHVFFWPKKIGCFKWQHINYLQELVSKYDLESKDQVCPPLWVLEGSRAVLLQLNNNISLSPLFSQNPSSFPTWFSVHWWWWWWWWWWCRLLAWFWIMQWHHHTMNPQFLKWSAAGTVTN